MLTMWWTASSTRKHEHPLDYVGAERLNPDHPQHQKIVGRMVEKNRRRDGHSQFWDRPMLAILDDLQGMPLESTVDVSWFPGYPGVTKNVSALLNHDWIDAIWLGGDPAAINGNHIKHEDVTPWVDVLRACVPPLPTIMELEERKPPADRHPDYARWSEIRGAVDFLEFWGQFPVVVDITVKEVPGHQLRVEQ